MNSIDTAFEKAAVLHGHSCPGLAIGVRAAVEALRLLNIDEECIRNKEFYCVAEHSACYLDGIQALCGCTFGNGHLILRSTGKTAFSFYNTGSGASVRLCLKELKAEGGKPEKIRHILHAPLDDIFAIGSVRAPLPERQPGSPTGVCSVCGERTDEDMLSMTDGRPVCIDCAK